MSAAKKSDLIEQNDSGPVDSKVYKFTTIVLSVFGLLFILAAVIVPIIIKNYYKQRIVDYKNIADLSGVGDFIGGTTVAFLTAASVFLLLATILMQRTEIKISQQSIVELIKQTEASIQQANDAREEVVRTNSTMKHQQFETTFFNMVNLHQTILSNLKKNELIGRELIAHLYEEFRSNGISAYREYKYQNYFSDKDVEDIFVKVYPYIEREMLNKELDFMWSMAFITDAEHDTLSQNIELGNYEFISYPELKAILIENPLIQNHDVSLKDELLRLSDKYHSSVYDLRLSDSFKIQYNSRWEEYKLSYYEKFYKENEHIFGHYYRNLYRIIKYINETELISDASKKEFRGILRAQLSSNELMMLFYNVVYSTKGQKFKTQLLGKNFFDDHLIIEDFVWNDDYSKLEDIK